MAPISMSAVAHPIVLLLVAAVLFTPTPGAAAAAASRGVLGGAHLPARRVDHSRREHPHEQQRVYTVGQWWPPPISGGNDEGSGGGRRALQQLSQARLLVTLNLPQTGVAVNLATAQDVQRATQAAVASALQVR